MIRNLLKMFCVVTALACAMSAQTGKTVAERLGYPANSRLLVIHADDFGMSHSVNRATAEALKNKWVTSASIMVPCPWLVEVAQFAKENPDADLGIHLTLNAEWFPYKWKPVTPSANVPSLVDKDGYFPADQATVYQQGKADQVEVEMRAQIDRAKSMGINISHLDTHMGTIIGTPQLFQVYLKLAANYGLPELMERHPEFQGVKLDQDKALLDRVLMVLPGATKETWLKAYEDILAPLPPGTYQLIVHLGYDDEELRGITVGHPDWGAAWRQNDFDLVKSPEFQKFLKDQNFILVGWKDLAKAK